MVINKRINSILVMFQPEGTEPPTSLVVGDEQAPGVVDGIMRQFRAHEDIVVTLPNKDIVVIPFYSILEITTGFEISEVTITDDVCRPYSGGGGGGGGGGDIPKTGMASITVSPKLTLDPAINSVFPIEYTGQDSIELYFRATEIISEQPEYLITITPGSDWYAAYFGDETIISANQGDPIQFSVQQEGGFLNFTIYAAEDPNDQSKPFIQIVIDIDNNIQ